MKTQITAAIAMSGSAAALALTVGFGGIGVTSPGSTTGPTTDPAASVAPAPPKAPGCDNCSPYRLKPAPIRPYLGKP